MENVGRPSVLRNNQQHVLQKSITNSLAWGKVNLRKTSPYTGDYIGGVPLNMVAIFSQFGKIMQKLH